jgi:hypothetical protein
MIKNTLFTILLTFIMTTTAVAQTDADQENDDSGIYIGLSLMGASFEVDDFLDGTDTGGELNLELGYDFNSNISIFLGLDGSNMNPDEGEDYSLAILIWEWKAVLATAPANFFHLEGSPLRD